MGELPLTSLRDSSWKKSSASEAMRGSSSTKHAASLAMWPLTWQQHVFVGGEGGLLGMQS